MTDLHKKHFPRIPRDKEIFTNHNALQAVFGFVLLLLVMWAAFGFPTLNNRPDVMQSIDKGELVRLQKRQLMENTSSINAHFMRRAAK